MIFSKNTGCRIAYYFPYTDIVYSYYYIVYSYYYGKWGRRGSQKDLGDGMKL